MFVDLLTALDCVTHEVAHTLPAVDHRSHLPSRPTTTELDRIATLLEAGASADLCAAYASWRTRDQKFADAVQRLMSLRDMESKPDATYQSELGQRLDEVRASRVLVGEAAESLRQHVAHELDAAFMPSRVAVSRATTVEGDVAAEVQLRVEEGSFHEMEEPDTWAPGEPLPGIPNDELLSIHLLTETEPPADQLDLPEDALDLPTPGEEETIEPSEGPGEEARPRAHLLGAEMEIRYEEFDAPEQ